MKFLNKYIILLIFIFSGCVSVNKNRMEINIPDVDNTGYNDTFFINGWDNLKKGDLKKAYENFRDSSSKDDRLFTGFGYVYLMKHKLKLAKRNFEKALELNPENLNASIGMATAEEVGGNIFNSFSLYTKLVAKHPENAWIKIRYEYIKSTKTEFYLKEAEKNRIENKDKLYIQNLQKAAFFSPEATDIKLKIANYFYEISDFNQAVFYYESALENRRNDISIMNKLAKSYEMNGKLDSAIITYKKISELSPGDITVSDKINDLKIKFHELDLPVRFKDIFFKDSVTREEFAALIGHYFKDYINTEGLQTVIITDIGASFVRNIIIKLCTAGIMKVRPDHTFRKNQKITRTSFVITLNSLLNYLQNNGYVINYTPSETEVVPDDITPLHKYYKIIRFLLNAKIIKLGKENKFNGSKEISPSEIIFSIRKIIKEIEKK